MTTPAASFSVRNITCDHYFADAQLARFHTLPADFSGRLPVLRIFGITADGQKCCAHIHGYFPSLWIRTNLPLSSDNKRQLTETVTTLINQIPDLSRDPQGPVVEISDALCKSIYGYTDADEYFAKVSLRDPRYIKFLSEGLQKQALSNYMAQPFASHVPYILQFFIDHDIFGMGLVHFDAQKIRFRRLPPNSPPSLQLGTYSPTTKMDVEFDAPIDALQNSRLLSDSPYVNTGLQNATPLPVPSPPDGHEAAVVLPTEEKYLNQLRAHCAQHTPEDLNSTLREEATLRGANVSIIDETFLDGMTQIVKTFRAPNRRLSHLEREPEAEEEDSPNWDRLEAETRGFTQEEDEEIDGNEELLSDSEDEAENEQLPDETNWRGEVEEEDAFCDERIQPQHEGATLSESFFESQPVGKPRAVNDCTALPTNNAVPHLCAMAVEVLALPEDPSTGIADPVRDPIVAVAVAVCTDRVLIVADEKQLLKALADVINRFNPDVLIGYDLVRGSWAYVCERAVAIQHAFIDLATRLESATYPSFQSLLIGRIKLEVWRIIRRERPLRCYEFGYATTTLLDRSFSQLLLPDLIALVNSEDSSGRRVAALHFLDMARCDLKILHTLDVFVRTSQMAQLYGIQYTEVINRGSQFRVESMLLRIAKKSAFLPPSVSVEQRNRMGAPETIPLNLEPASDIYYDPVAVLDFQSLYPSVLIAYNYCYSSCLGKVERLCSAEGGRMMKMGALDYERLPMETLKGLVERGEVHVAPTGCAFVKPSVQKGLLGAMLKEMLDARVMVKKSMKRYTGDQKTYRQLDAQQLALKLVANTTYGYAAANWSGRMPCEEVAEAIVSKGREALERAIELIRTAPPESTTARE
ncbi:DNA polymerase [Aphelenchoides fujianensis]|nr:DNA polymerase [Aphelenchoides fujianensis]